MLIDPRKTRQEYAAEVAEYREEERVQSILVSKIFAEYVTAFEDLGALGYAIRNRGTIGVFEQYLTSETRDAGNFFPIFLIIQMTN